MLVIFENCIMSEAKHHSSYTPPSSMEELKALPLRDYTFYRMSWFLPDTLSTVEAFQKLITLVTTPMYLDNLTHDSNNDLLVRYFNALGMFHSIPEEYYLYPDTIGVIENILINTTNGYDQNIAIDVYVKNVQNTHRVYKFVFSKPIISGAKPIGRISVEIYECTSNNVTLPMAGTRDVHLLFRNASTYNDLTNPVTAIPMETQNSTATSVVVYYDENDIPCVTRTFWRGEEVIFAATEQLPKEKYVVLHECTRHGR